MEDISNLINAFAKLAAGFVILLIIAGAIYLKWRADGREKGI